MVSTLGTQLGALSHRPQRRLLVELLYANPQDDTPVDDDEPKPKDEELELLLDFRHYHLPELEDKGLIDYDRENNVITKGPNFEEIKPVLELIEKYSDELPDDWL
ncbi:DUF7344 domain-containing protein [Halorarius halobius]|uniref:DUF7344 domain-containing protein n=1 Tax=Halorarius halobius TaxID=2962671 RepID=UPI0020CCDE35|nr:transcriptional regulator [Halorarius halobius]